MAEETIKIISKVVPRRRDGVVLPAKSIIQQTGGAPSEHTHPYLPAIVNEDGSYTVDISKVLFKGSIVAEQEVSAFGTGESGGAGGGSITIVDNLLSSSTDAALSANQGRVLKGMIDEIRKEPAVSEMSKLKDVKLGVLADGDMLKYDAAQGKWVNAKGVSGNWKDLQGKPEGLTDENIAKWVNESHKHLNLKVLDTVTVEKVAAWDAVAADWRKVFYFDEQGYLHAKVNFIGDYEVSSYGQGTGTGGGGTITIVDNLLSSSTDAALSANQGRVLKGLIDEIRQQGTGGVSSWNDLKDKPSWIGASKPSYSWGEITGMPDSFVPSEHNHDSRYVTGLGTSGDSITWVKNGSTNYLTAPYAGRAERLANTRRFFINDPDGSNYNGYDFDGSGNVDMYLPRTMTGFYSIMSDRFVGTASNADKLGGKTASDFYSIYGGSLHGDILFPSNNRIAWERNTDFAKIGFKNYGDTDSDSHLLFSVGDNGDEYFKWDIIEGNTTHNVMNLKKSGLQVKVNCDVQYKMQVNGANSVGSYPCLKLHVANTAWAQFLLNPGVGRIELRDGYNTQTGSYFSFAVGNTVVKGFLTATGEITAYSDIRLKSNIKPLTNRGTITPITYTKDGKESIGFSAQEVRELYPELVKEDSGDMHYLSVNYSQYVAVLQAQIIEMQKQIDELKNK